MKNRDGWMDDLFRRSPDRSPHIRLDLRAIQVNNHRHRTDQNCRQDGVEACR